MQISPEPTHPPMYDSLLTLYGQVSHKFSVTYGIYAGLMNGRGVSIWYTGRKRAVLQCRVKKKNIFTELEQWDQQYNSRLPI